MENRACVCWTCCSASSNVNSYCCPSLPGGSTFSAKILKTLLGEPCLPRHKNERKGCFPFRHTPEATYDIELGACLGRCLGCWVSKHAIESFAPLFKVVCKSSTGTCHDALRQGDAIVGLRTCGDDAAPKPRAYIPYVALEPSLGEIDLQSILTKSTDAVEAIFGSHDVIIELGAASERVTLIRLWK